MISNNYLNNSVTNSLVALPIFFSSIFENSIYQESRSTKNYEKPMDNREVFYQLPSQHITLEDSQMNTLLSFVAKLLNESSDLEGEIVDMVNENFWDLI